MPYTGVMIVPKTFGLFVLTACAEILELPIKDQMPVNVLVEAKAAVAK